MHLHRCAIACTRASRRTSAPCTVSIGHMSRIKRHASHVTSHASHITRHTSHVTSHASHVTCHASHITRHTSHVTRLTSHVTRHTSHVTRHTSQQTRLSVIARPRSISRRLQLPFNFIQYTARTRSPLVNQCVLLKQALTRTHTITPTPQSHCHLLKPLAHGAPLLQQHRSNGIVETCARRGRVKV